MKKFFYTFVFAMLSLSSFAQLAPDFTVTDAHGNEHSLYADYLNQNKVVVLDLFFVDCPPCNALAPALQAYWEELQANNAPVQVLSLSSSADDTNEKIIGFEEQHGLTFPAAGSEGGSVEAQALYTTGEFGEFFGYPTLIVISPDGTVQYDAWGDTLEDVIAILSEWVNNAVASSTSTNDLTNAIDMEIFPIPATDFVTVDLSAFSQAKTIQIFSGNGQLVQTIETNKAQETITTSDFAAGNYFLFAKDGEKVARQQFSIVK